MFEKAIPQYCKMMKLSRIKILKELSFKLNKLFMKKRIEKEEKIKEVRSSNIVIIQNPRNSILLAYNLI